MGPLLSRDRGGGGSGAWGHRGWHGAAGGAPWLRAGGQPGGREDTCPWGGLGVWEPWRPGQRDWGGLGAWRAPSHRGGRWGQLKDTVILAIPAGRGGAPWGQGPSSLGTRGGGGGAWTRSPVREDDGSGQGGASDGAPQGAEAAVSLRQGLRAAQGPWVPAGAWAARGASWRGSAGGGQDGDPRVAPLGPPVSACGPGRGPRWAALLPCPPSPPASASAPGAGGAGGGCQGARRDAGVPPPGGAGGHWPAAHLAAPGWQRSQRLRGRGTPAIPTPPAPAASAAVPPGRPWAGVLAQGALDTPGCRGHVGALLPAPGASWRGAPGWPQGWAARGGPSHGPLRGAAAVGRGGG